MICQIIPNIAVYTFRLKKIDKSLQKFWEIIIINDTSSLVSNTEKFCENHFKTTHYRTSSGQYVMSMAVVDATLLIESSQKKTR